MEAHIKHCILVRPNQSSLVIESDMRFHNIAAQAHTDVYPNIRELPRLINWTEGKVVTSKPSLVSRVIGNQWRVGLKMGISTP